MTSSTDELCKLLEERGLSYQTNYLHTSWCVGSKLYEAVDNFDGTLAVGNLTPEQAIAATLGSDASAVRLAEKLRGIAEEMRNVGASSMKPHELLACYATEVDKVADLLKFAATLGNGTCEMVTSGTPCKGNTDVACTCCGAYNIGEYYDGCGHRTAPKFCPECGRRVER